MPSNSLWLEGHARKYETLRGDAKADVVILGGGIAGLTAAYLLSAAGVGVVVLEARTVVSGTSGHTTAHVTSQHDIVYAKRIKRFGLERARLIAEANESAIRLIAGIVEAEGISCGFLPQDSFIFTEDAKKEREIEDEAEAASKLGIMADVTSKAEFLFPYVAAVRFRNQAMFQPVQYLDGVASAIVRNGGRIYEMSRALHITDNAVQTDDGRVRTGFIVVATHIPVVNFPGWYHSRMYQNRSYVVALDNAPAVSGMWSSNEKDGHTYRMYGDKLLVCGGDNRCGTEKEIDHYDVLRKYTLGRFPSSRPSNFWSAQDAITLDGLPYIGRYSEHTRAMFVATGFGKWGMTQGTLAGSILCDLILDRENPWADVYSPQRKIVPAAVGHAVAMNAATAWHLASHAFKAKCPTCSHFKCKLVWNRDERSWDCPCHGSRFAEDGSVLDTPAIHGIEPSDNPECKQ
jgi:glycine/D-amino acid oxidase-like deaminating enzyme